MNKKEIKRYDKIWSEVVLRRYLHCPRCGKSEVISPHHIIKRRKYSTRWDLRNGIGLCRGCHYFAENWPVDFISWLLTKKSHWGKKWLEALVRKGLQAGNKEIIRRDLMRLERKYKKEKEKLSTTTH